MKVWELRWLLNEMPDNWEVYADEDDLSLPADQMPKTFEMTLFDLTWAEYQKDSRLTMKYLIDKFRKEFGNRAPNGARI